MKMTRFTGFRDSTDTTKQVMAMMFGTKPEDINIDGCTQETATTSEVTIEVRNNTQLLARFSFDHVPSIKVLFWPSIGAEWRDRKRKWPSAEQVHAIVQNGCHLVPKSSPGGDTSKEWRFSFSLPEKMLCEFRSPAQRQCYAIFKILFYKYLKPIKSRDPDGRGLFSYLCKSVMMWACEEFPPEDEMWMNLQKCLDMLLERLQCHLRQKSLQNYFVTDINLMGQLSDDVVDEAVSKITEMRSNMLLYIPYNLPEMLVHGQYLTGKLSLIYNVASFVAGFRQFKNSMRNVFKMNKK